MVTEGYDFEAMQRRWQPVWQSLDLFTSRRTSSEKARETPGASGQRRYIVDMFAYPSGDLHMGHAEAYAFGDAIARYWIQRGYDVLHPIGWDSFGLPAENAAIKRDQHPATWTYANIETQAESFRKYAVSVDWHTRLHTSDPSYYRWTQWLFLRFFERGLAYRARAAVNWCPHDQTVLANEQVVAGRCERCGTEVVHRDLTQWFFRITEYADRLVDDMDALTGHWPEPVLTMQRNWIGRSVQENGTTYRLHDWLVSRQRFWGCPIPIVHCPDCGEVPVPDDQLPVTLPDMRGAELRPRGESPLAANREWASVPCPRCGGPGTRDTDTMDTFVDSSWYFLRYPSIDYTDGPFDPAVTRPVDEYVGGVEHAILHLLYARFFTKVLYDMGLIDFTEPFRSLLNQGQVILNGAAMSKSKGNLVDLGEQLATYGVDAVRLTMVFAGPPEEDIDWADVSPAGAVRFLSRVLRLSDEVRFLPVDEELRRTTHRLLHQITELIEAHRFNVAVARTMELANVARTAIDDGRGAREAVEAIAVVLSLFAPYTAEEMWSRLGHEPGVARAGWPAIDPELATANAVVCVVQINGKVCDRVDVPPDITADDLLERVLDSAVVLGAMGGRTIARTIIRPPKLINFLI